MTIDQNSVNLNKIFYKDSTMLGLFSSKNKTATGPLKISPKSLKKFEALHQKLPKKPAFGDWLSSHPEEGQSFTQFYRQFIYKPTSQRKVIYILPIGPFTAKQYQIMKLCSDFIHYYFNLTVKIQKEIKYKDIPKLARRIHPSWGDEQILSSYVWNTLLKPNLPADGFAYLSITSIDLYPRPNWNFVYGEASSADRSAVFSLYRTGNPDKGSKSFQQCLTRILKIACHETAHLFTMKHCINWLCLINGMNHEGELDRSPLWLCPECLKKLCFINQLDPLKRFKNLTAFFKKNNLSQPLQYYEKAIKIFR